MAFEATKDGIEAKAQEIAAEFAGGVSLGDLVNVLPKFMEVVEGVKELPGAEKKRVALELLESFCNKVDLPGPDVIVKPILLKIAPHLIDMVASAAGGGFDINA